MNGTLLYITISLLLCLTYTECTEADEATAFILYTQWLNKLLSSPFFFNLLRKNLHNLLHDFLNMLPDF